jgi:hypothetical protein
MSCIFCVNNSIPITLSDSAILVLEVVFLALYALIFFFVWRARHKKTIRNMIITLIAVVLFELMIDPLVANERLSSWTYYYRDLNIIITLGWVVIVSAAISLIDHFFSKLSSFKRFWLYVIAVDGLSLPAEIFLVQSGVRVYSESLLSTTYGALIPFTGVPFEVGLAIPMYFMLVIGFTKYWETILDGK